VAWGGTSATNLEILIMQKKTIRTIFRLGLMEHCKPIFKQHKILTVVLQDILEIIGLIKYTPQKQRNEVHTHNTQQGINIDIPQHRLQKFSNTPSYSGLKFYNLLPNQLKLIEDKHKFTNSLKEYLIK